MSGWVSERVSERVSEWASERASESEQQHARTVARTHARTRTHAHTHAHAHAHHPRTTTTDLVDVAKDLHHLPADPGIRAHRLEQHRGQENVEAALELRVGVLRGPRPAGPRQAAAARRKREPKQIAGSGNKNRGSRKLLRGTGGGVWEVRSRWEKGAKGAKGATREAARWARWSVAIPCWIWI